MSNFYPPSTTATLKCCYDERDELRVTAYDGDVRLVFNRNSGFSSEQRVIRVKRDDVVALGEYLVKLGKSLYENTEF